LRNLESLFKKSEFNIKDVAYIIQRETQTVRMWEKKGFIYEADMRAENNWRMYSTKRLIEVLEQILNRDWKRQVIKNVQELRYCIDELKNKQ
jgi:DNA-binding transcriptional MerR regulator